MLPRVGVSSTVLSELGSPASRSWVADFGRDEREPEPAVPDPEKSSKQRNRIWDLHHSLHCSIIGTCLTTGELKQLLLRLNVRDVAVADDHALHQLGVMLAGNPKTGAKHLQRALDRRHGLAIKAFARAKDEFALLERWNDAVKLGDIPGAYWAVLTHPATTDELVKRVFGEVHMLSHLVGAANRADIRRLRQLEENNAGLAATIERQQRQLRDGFTARDETIRRLTDALARKAREDVAAIAVTENTKALVEALADREARLTDEIARREKIERRLDKLDAERHEAVAARERVAAERDAMRAEIAALENQVAVLLADEAPADAGDLAGQCVLYVGGRANQTPRLRRLVECMNGRFLHHDGGIEHNAALLPGLVSRADLVVFPVDCVSHDAAGALKKACRHCGKRYVPLRTASLSGLLSGLAQLYRRTVPPHDRLQA